MTALDEVWISTQEVARLLQISVDATRRRLDRFETREVEGLGRGGKRLEIRLASLGPEAMERWNDQLDTDTEDVVSALNAEPEISISDERILVSSAFRSASNRIREQFQRRSRILSACESIEGRRDLELWAEQWNASNPKDPVSAPTIYRWRKEQREHGLSGYLAREEKLPQSTVRDDWFGWFKSLYLQENRPAVTQAHFMTLGMAMQAGHIESASEFPSHNAFIRRLRREVNPSMVAACRLGDKKFYDTHGINIKRDYSAVAAGRVWVGDTHTIDVFVQENGQKIPVTCYLTLFLDFKTYTPMGWHFHTSAPSAENSMRALKNGIEKWGVPDEILVDNGREYKNKDFAGVTRKHMLYHNGQQVQSLMSILRIKLRFALVYNARAKPIERQFRIFKELFSKNFMSYKGGNVLEKPERLKGILKRGDIIEFAELIMIGNKFLSEILPAMPCYGEHHKGKSRRELLEAEMLPLDRLTAETYSHLVSKTVAGKIHPTGFHLTKPDAWFWAEWMTSYKRTAVVMRYDPDDLSVAWFYEAKGAFIGEASIRMAVGALIDGDDMISKARLEKQMSEKHGELKVIKAFRQQLQQYTPQQRLEAMATAAQARPINVPMGGPIRITAHDHVASTLSRQERVRDFDILATPELDAPKRVLRQWEDEPIAAAG